MFKRIIKSVCLLLAVAAGSPVAAAQDGVSGYPVGLCNGQLNTNSLIKHDKAGEWVESAVHIPAAQAATVARNYIDQIKAGLCSTVHVDSLRVWVRSDLNGPDLAYGAAGVDDLSKGWNTVDLLRSWEIPADPKDGFYIGFSILQNGRGAGPSVIRTPGEGSFYLRLGEGEWEDRSYQGTLCVEGLVYGDYLPKANAELVSVTPDKVFIMSEGTLGVTAEVLNHGTLTITGLDIEAQVEGAAEPCTAHVECDIPFGETKAVRFTISPRLDSATPEVRNAVFTITGLDQGEDENPTDNSASATFEVMERAFRRVVLIEEFTTEKCPNCPAAATKLHSVLANPTYAESAIAVCHHAGYYTDWLTLPESKDYTWFYNANGATYAPAMMMDRTATVESNTPVFFPNSESLIRQTIDSRLAVPAEVSVGVGSEFVDNKTLTVNVFGERIPGVDDVRLTVFLVENNVPAIEQAGGGEDYIHQHVLRAASSTWGDPIDWTGDTYSKDYTFELKDRWNTSELQVVAFVSRFDDSDALACGVENAAFATAGTSGIAAATPDAVKTPVAYYSIDGRRLGARPERGLYITVYSDGSTSKNIVY